MKFRSIFQVVFSYKMQTSNTYTGFHLENKGIQITSSIPVSVVAVSGGSYITSFLVRPTTSVLGKKFYALTGNQTSGSYPCQVTGISLSDATNVRMILTDGTWRLTKVNAMQTLTYSNKSDLSGTVLETDKPIAVTSGCAYIRARSNPNGGGPEAEMMPPVSRYQNEFPLVSFDSSTLGDLVRVVSAQDNTEIELDGKLIGTVNAGEVFNFSIAEGYAGVLSATHPVTVTQFGQAYSPHMNPRPLNMIVVPSTQELSTGSCMFSTLLPLSIVNRFEFIILVTLGDISSSILLNGFQIKQQYSQIGTSGYFHTRVGLSSGNYTVSSQNPNGKFSVIVYGFGSYAGYAYVCGMSSHGVSTTSTSTTSTSTSTSTTTRIPTTLTTKSSSTTSTSRSTSTAPFLTTTTPNTASKIRARIA